MGRCRVCATYSFDCRGYRCYRICYVCRNLSKEERKAKRWARMRRGNLWDAREREVRQLIKEGVNIDEVTLPRFLNEYMEEETGK